MIIIQKQLHLNSLIELHAYQINDSLLAPMFKVIEKPNDFVKSTKNYENQEMTLSESERLIFLE